MNQIQIQNNWRQDSNWNYEVEKIPLMTPEGNESGIFATRRIDTKACLGAVSGRYGILQNNAIFGEAEELFDTMSLGSRKAKYVVTNNGAKARAIFDFENIGFKVAERDDVILRLTVQNSFDGSLGASLSVGFVRIICTNGFAAPVGKGSQIARKHTLTITNHITEEKVKTAINAFEKSREVFGAFVAKRISQHDGINFLGNSVRTKLLSERMARDIAQIWDSPTYRLDAQRNAWGLYNAATEHLTHNVAPKMFELANRTTHGFVNALASADRRGMWEKPEEEFRLN